MPEGTTTNLAPRAPEMPIASPEEHLEQVRDILFGAQQRKSEQRIARLDDRITRELKDIREESRERIEALELLLRQQTQALAERLKVETAQRTEAVEKLRNEKTDRKHLAQLLSMMAMQLSSDDDEPRK